MWVESIVCNISVVFLGHSVLAGIGLRMEISVPGMVGDGYKYLSPCSFLDGASLTDSRTAFKMTGDE